VVLAIPPAMPDKLAMRLGAIILAGGRSTRMGRPKEWLPFRGDTLLGTLCATLAACTERVVVVARDAAQPLPALPAGVARTHDEHPDRGPLEGLAAGLRFLAGTGGLAADDPAFVTACDHPFVTRAVVMGFAAAVGDHDVAMPELAGTLQPLLAVYRLRALAAIERLLASGTRAPQQLATILPTHRIGEPELRAIDGSLAFLRNVNTPADYDDVR
jgi:molybdenum cofactor guanylyltransferase